MWNLKYQQIDLKKNEGFTWLFLEKYTYLLTTFNHYYRVKTIIFNMDDFFRFLRHRERLKFRSHKSFGCNCTCNISLTQVCCPTKIKRAYSLCTGTEHTPFSLSTHHIFRIHFWSKTAKGDVHDVPVHQNVRVLSSPKRVSRESRESSEEERALSQNNLRSSTLSHYSRCDSASRYNSPKTASATIPRSGVVNFTTQRRR